MMTINDFNISMIRGNSETIEITCLDASDTLIDFVTGDTVYFSIKDHIISSNYILQKIITTFTNGIAFVILAPSDTNGLKCKNYVYDVQLKTSTGIVNTIIPPSQFSLEVEVTDE